jgi:ankyrin repeat protein
MSCLHAAAKSRKSEPVLRALLRGGCDVNGSDKLGRSPIHLACKSGNLPGVHALLSNGADINVACSSGLTPLAQAARCGHSEICEYLIFHGSAISAIDRSGICILEHAVESASLATVMDCVSGYLQAAHMPPSLVVRDVSKALRCAARHGYIGILQRLSDLLKVQYGLTPCDTVFRDALLASVRENCVPSLEFLLELGVPVNNTGAESERRDRTPIVLAARHGNVKVLNLILMYGGCDTSGTLVTSCLSFLCF